MLLEVASGYSVAAETEPTSMSQAPRGASTAARDLEQTTAERRPAPTDLEERVWFVIAIVLSALMLLALPFVMWWGTGKPPIMLAVFTAAILGSVINISDQVRTYFRNKSWRHVLRVLAFKLLVACALAIFTYVFLMSGFLKGPLFPEFQQIEKPYDDMIAFANETKPKTNLDVARILVWSFVAGYSERFIAQLIARVESQTKGAQSP